MAHLAGRVGTAAAGGVRLWALDNEPFLWNSTHHDVHPAGVSYDELWTKTTSIAAAIKAQDPDAKILGPADWGWCAYFFSGADGCSPGADRAAHGGEDFLPWYLDQAKAWEIGARTSTPRLPRHPLLPSGLRRRPHERRVDRDVRPPAEDAQEPLRPDVHRRVVDRPGCRAGRVPDPADEGVDRGALPRARSSRSASTTGAPTTGSAAPSRRPRRSRSSDAKAWTSPRGGSRPPTTRRPRTPSSSTATTTGRERR